MKYVENGVPEDFAKLCFAGMTVTLCELTEEEYMKVVFGIDNYRGRKKRGAGSSYLPIEDDEPKQYNESIDNLELSVRAYNGLKRAGIETIGQLVAMTEWDVSKIRNMGVKSVKEVKEALASMGLSLKQEDKEIL